jgi:hypothetical protein
LRAELRLAEPGPVLRGGSQADAARSGGPRPRPRSGQAWARPAGDDERRYGGFCAPGGGR